MDAEDDFFEAAVAFNPTFTLTPKNAVADVYAWEDEGFTTPLPITDLNGNPLAHLVAGGLEGNIYPRFKVPSGEWQVRVKSGAYVTPMTSVYAAGRAVAATVGQDAEDARTARDEAVGAVASLPETLDTEDGAIAALVVTPSQTRDAVESRQRVRGNTGKFYRMTRCALRPVGAPNYWQIITDTNHEPVGVESVEVTTSAIILHYPAGSTVSGGHVTPDETLAGLGYMPGQSEGLSSMSIYLNRLAVSDYISWNGTSWVSSGGRYTGITFSTVTGTLTLNHDPIPGLGIAVVARDTPLTVKAGSLGATTTQLFFYDSTGAKVLAASTDMKVYVTRLGQGTLNPQLVPANATANLWVSADLEIPAPA